MYALSTAPGTRTRAANLAQRLSGISVDSLVSASFAVTRAAPSLRESLLTELDTSCVSFSPGRAAVAVIRATGANARDVLRLLPGRSQLPPERTATLATFADPLSGVRRRRLEKAQVAVLPDARRVPRCRSRTPTAPHHAATLAPPPRPQWQMRKHMS